MTAELPCADHHFCKCATSGTLVSLNLHRRRAGQTRAVVERRRCNIINNNNNNNNNNEKTK
jgi:hypothetical protein